MPQFKCLIDQPIRPNDDGDPDLSRDTGKPLRAGQVINASLSTREFDGAIWRAYGISWIIDHTPVTRYLEAIGDVVAPPVVTPPPVPEPIPVPDPQPTNDHVPIIILSSSFATVYRQSDFVHGIMGFLQAQFSDGVDYLLPQLQFGAPVRVGTVEFRQLVIAPRHLQGGWVATYSAVMA